MPDIWPGKHCSLSVTPQVVEKKLQKRANHLLPLTVRRESERVAGLNTAKSLAGMNHAIFPVFFFFKTLHFCWTNIRLKKKKAILVSYLHLDSISAAAGEKKTLRTALLIYVLLVYLDEADM